METGVLITELPKIGKATRRYHLFQPLFLSNKQSFLLRDIQQIVKTFWSRTTLSFLPLHYFIGHRVNIT